MGMVVHPSHCSLDPASAIVFTNPIPIGRQLELPEHDQEMPHAQGKGWISRHRFYDFSNADMELLPEFADLPNRPDVCLRTRVESGPQAFSLVGEGRVLNTPNRGVTYGSKLPINVG